MLTSVLISAFAFIGIVFLLGILYIIQGPPFVPSGDESIKQMLKLVKSYPATHILDMGSGDGKLVILLAQQGYTVTGIELNPLLVWRSRQAIKKAGLTDKATIVWGNFWSFKVADYDLIILFVIKHIMPRLEKKLLAELKPGTHIVSNYFVFPTLKPIKKLSQAQAYKI